MSTPQLLSPDAVAMITHRQGYSPERYAWLQREFPGVFLARGPGLVGRVSLSLWHSASGSWPSFTGRFLERNRKISLQGSSTKGHVVKLLILRFHPMRKESLNTINFSLMAYVVIRLDHGISVAIEQFQNHTHKKTTGPLFQGMLSGFSSVQLLSRVWLFATPWIAALQASLSITNSQSSLRLTSFESVMPSSHLILCRPLLLLPAIPPSIRVFPNESTLRMRWTKY